MTAHRPTGWNTWDFRGFNCLVYLSNGRTKISVMFGIWDETLPALPHARKAGQVRTQFRWSDVTIASCSRSWWG